MKNRNSAQQSGMNPHVDKKTSLERNSSGSAVKRILGSVSFSSTLLLLHIVFYNAIVVMLAYPASRRVVEFLFPAFRIDFSSRVVGGGRPWFFHAGLPAILFILLVGYVVYTVVDRIEKRLIENEVP